MNTGQKFSLGSWLRSRTGLALLVFLAISAFYLITEHTAHVFGFLPYALLLLCPLLHLFMHGGHGDHTESQGGRLAAGEHGEHSGHAGHTETRGQNPEGGQQ